MLSIGWVCSHLRHTLIRHVSVLMVEHGLVASLDMNQNARRDRAMQGDLSLGESWYCALCERLLTGRFKLDPTAGYAVGPHPRIHKD